MLQLEAKSQGEPNTVCVQVIVAPVQVANHSTCKGWSTPVDIAGTGIITLFVNYLSLEFGQS